jgi:hypothetical protein
MMSKGNSGTEADSTSQITSTACRTQPHIQ